MTEQERHESSVSRRTMLKRIGAAGAVAWVAPAISSLNTPAFAASGPGNNCADCANNVCGVNPLAVCGSNRQTGDCLCAQTTTGDCNCFQPICFPGAQSCA